MYDGRERERREEGERESIEEWDKAKIINKYLRPKMVYDRFEDFEHYLVCHLKLSTATISGYIDDTYCNNKIKRYLHNHFNFFFTFSSDMLTSANVSITCRVG